MSIFHHPALQEIIEKHGADYVLGQCASICRTSLQKFGPDTHRHIEVAKYIPSRVAVARLLIDCPTR